MGRKKQAHYRIVVADSASPRDGRFVETLGYYKPLSHPARLVLDLEAVDQWLAQGAQPSKTVGSLVKKARKGGDDRVALGEDTGLAEGEPAAEREATKAEKLAEEQVARAEAADAA